jgi:hypothetical protein
MEIDPIDISGSIPLTSIASLGVTDEEADAFENAIMNGNLKFRIVIEDKE